ncbi:hypothetical protein TNCV_1103891 [Trichonephila clavipes]|nr:hypothetical protein TNCV_1103891 [Trichonephila clavipes]
MLRIRKTGKFTKYWNVCVPSEEDFVDQVPDGSAVPSLQGWNLQEHRAPKVDTRHVSVIEIDAHEIHCGKELVLHLSLAADLSTTQVTVQFVSLPPNFQEEHTVVRSGVPQHLFRFHQPLESIFGSTNS